MTKVITIPESGCMLVLGAVVLRRIVKNAEMDTDSLNFDFHKRLRYIAFGVIGLTAVAQIPIAWVLSHVIHTSDLWISEAFLAVLALWTFKVDYARLSINKQIASILVESVLAGCGGLFGAYKIFHFLYLCLVAKASLNLPLRKLIGTLVAVYGVQAACTAGRAAIYYQTVAANSGGMLPPKYPLIFTIEQHLYNIFSFVLVAAMVRTMVSERVSRLRAEQLAEDVESLIVTNERSRISRDIHDGLGHTLTSLNIQLEVAKTMFDKERDVSREALGVAKDLASDSLAEVRRSVHMIREADPTPFNLSEAVTGLAARAKRNHDLNIDVVVDPAELPLFKAHNVFCIVQEALTNAQRHANAKNIQIACKKDAAGLDVRIIDDGSGFNPIDDLQGLGLRSMNERAEGLGGKLNIESAPGQGTRVQITVPL
jgi:signal transduction histidine kinase